MKRCCIYKTENEYKIITLSESDIGLYLYDSPVFIISIESDIEDIKNMIFKSLNSSRKEISTPNPKEWSVWQKEQLKKMKEKSFINLYKRSKYVDIMILNNILIISPGKYMHNKGIIIIEDQLYKMEYSLEKEIEITKKIIEILQIEY